MRILYVATRSPWPPADGGRVLMARTVCDLAARGHAVTFVGPAATSDQPRALPPGVQAYLVPSRRRSAGVSFARSLLRGRPLTIERHDHPAVTRTVARLIEQQPFDIVHVEQLQALAFAEPALERGLPVALRAQNVESVLWEMLATLPTRFKHLAAIEARRLACWERASLQRVSAAVALTVRDAEKLRELAPGAAIRVVRMPMTAELPKAHAKLAGEPPVVTLASGRWLPNRDGVRWFTGEIWPHVRELLPKACLHVFGATAAACMSAGVHLHGPLADSRGAFSDGSILAVPLRIASGTRARILEAWARGIPVVATPAAAAGLETAGSLGVRLASTPREFAAALHELNTSPSSTQRLVAEGRSILQAWHAPEMVVRDLEQAYTDTIAGRS